MEQILSLSFSQKCCLEIYKSIFDEFQDILTERELLVSDALRGINNIKMAQAFDENKLQEKS